MTTAPFGDLDREMRLRVRIDKLNDLIEDLKRDNERLRDLAIKRRKQSEGLAKSRAMWRGRARRDVDAFLGREVSR